MKRLLAAELLKLRTTRTFVGMVVAAGVLSLAAVLLNTLLVNEYYDEDYKVTLNTDFSGLFIALLGILGITGEWRHRTITSSVLAMPDRVRFLLAKAIAYAGAGVVLSLIVSVLVLAVGTLVMQLRDLPAPTIGELADLLWRNLVIAALAAAFGVGLGGIVRNQIAAIIGLLAFSFAIEPALLSLVPDVGRYGPTAGLPNAIVGVQFFDEDPLETVPAIAALLAWVAVLTAAAAVLLRRRDLT